MSRNCDRQAADCSLSKYIRPMTLTADNPHVMPFGCVLEVYLESDFIYHFPAPKQTLARFCVFLNC